jgi:hypothetical protein
VTAEELGDRGDAEGRRDPKRVERRAAVLAELVLAAESGGQRLVESVTLPAVGAVGLLARRDVTDGARRARRRSDACGRRQNGDGYRKEDRKTETRGQASTRYR